MVRLAILAVLAVPLSLPAAEPDRAATKPEPQLYELLINGESFTIELNRQQRLESNMNPGTAFEVALRVAQVQKLALNTIEFNYDRNFRVSDDRRQPVRTVTLQHELGFSVVLADLGGPLDEAAQQRVLRTLTESMQRSIREQKGTELEVSDPFDSPWKPGTARCVALHYRSAQNLRQTCAVYVLSAPEFSCSCIIQFADRDREDLGPLVNAVLDSIRAIP